ncbi:MAG: hypothetical protein ACYDCK_15045 [Thermoplasmatota archaeon]
MNRTALRLLIVSLAALTALPLLAANVHADDPCTRDKMIAITDPTSGAAVAYFLIDTNQASPGFSEQWLYLESNNQAGLQRGGAGPSEPAWQALNGASPIGPISDDTDTCQASLTPDTLVF